MINFLTRPRFQLSSSGSFGGGGVGPVNSVLTLTGDLGGAVPPDGAGNIDTIGGASGLIQVTGTPGSNMLEWDVIGGTDAQVLMGRTGDFPIFATIVSSNGTVVATRIGNTLDLVANAGAIDISQLTPEVGGAVTPVAGNIDIIGALAPYKNITTYNGGAATLEVRLNDAINWPETTSLTSGTISFDGNQFLHAYGNGGLADNNTFLGNLAGNFTMGVSADENTGLGSSCLSQITTASENLAAGAFALRLLTTGEFNVAAGLGSGENITTGSFNTLLGHSTGDAYVSDESSNILIGAAVGGVAGEDNTIRIGRDGVGLGEQNAFYAAGIFNRSFGATSRVLQIDSNFKIGSSTGTNGQVLIGGGTGPVWNTITEGNGISIVNGANSIAISSDAADEFETNAGIAVPAAGVLRILGGQLTNTTGTGFTVSINLNQGDDGEIIIAKTGNASEYGTLVSSDNTVQITPDVSTSGSFNINLRANGGAAGRGAFKGYYSANAVNVTGDGTEYLLGNTPLGLTESYDPASAFNPGNGAGTPASYTAPVDGIYSFTLGLTLVAPLTASGALDPQAFYQLVETQLIINGTPLHRMVPATGTNSNAVGSQTGGTYQRSYGFTFEVELNASDVVTWSVRTRNIAAWNTVPGQKIISLAGTTNYAVSGGGAGSQVALSSSLNATYVSGYIITPL